MELKPIRSTDKKNMKITFYLSEELYSKYKHLQKMAKNHGYKLDLTNDFARWFEKQLGEAERAISKFGK